MLGHVDSRYRGYVRAEVPKRRAKQDMAKWLKAQKTLVLPAILEARPGIDKGRGIGHTEINPAIPMLGLFTPPASTHR